MVPAMWLETDPRLLKQLLATTRIASYYMNDVSPGICLRMPGS